VTAAQKARIDGLAAEKLAALKAATAADLVSGAPRRALGVGAARPLEHSEGRILLANMVLAPGTATRLRVPTELSLMVVIELAAGESVASVALPARDHLAAAVAMALKGESRALAEATQALDEAHARKPPGARTWADALRSIQLDPRLPREKLTGSPSWSLVFEPWDEAHGGWTSVSLDAETFRVLGVNGRGP
jgi:hypothetical protein